MLVRIEAAVVKGDAQRRGQILNEIPPWLQAIGGDDLAGYIKVERKRYDSIICSV